MALSMQTLSAKPFVGQELKIRARSTAVSAMRSPVVVRASQDQDAVSWRFTLIALLRSLQQSPTLPAKSGL